MVSIYGWGVVAPGSPNISAFSDLVAKGGSALSPSLESGLGSGLFFVGEPEFDFAQYRPWFDERGASAHFARLQAKMGDNALFAIGALVQALQGNPVLDKAVRAADVLTHIYVGSGLGDQRETINANTAFERAVRVWNRFWAHPARCQAMRDFRGEGRTPASDEVPRDPELLEPDSEERREARATWDAFWAQRSEGLREFEAHYKQIETLPVGYQDDDTAAQSAIRTRQRAHRKLLEEFACPMPPWDSVDPRLLWAVPNVAAAQMSILLGTHGPAWAPAGACATFGIALKLGYDAISRGDARIAIVGTSDPRPHPTLVSAFHRARLVPATGAANQPLTQLLGTHIAGGSCVWIIADDEYMNTLGVKPVGPRIAAASISSDAFHIITPSAEGPKIAIRQALASAQAKPEQIAAWDLHATGTPGDIAELRLAQEFIGPGTAISARKGMFGHGMANSTGWELTALALEMAAGKAWSTGVERSAIHRLADGLRTDQLVCETRPLSGNLAVKVALGVGGITCCVVLSKN
jgi:3-oxoacyl-(acyl-carrier-protein) synthase